MLSKKKKILIIVSFCLLLVITGVLNLVINNTVADDITHTTNNQTYSNFFDEYRTSRTSSRQEEMLILDGIISSAASDQATIDKAIEKRDALYAKIEMELVLEAAVKARGFDDCIVITSANDVNVVVKTANQLDPDQTRLIIDAIESSSDYVLDNVSIFEWNNLQL